MLVAVRWSRLPLLKKQEQKKCCFAFSEGVVVGRLGERGSQPRKQGAMYTTATMQSTCHTKPRVPCIHYPLILAVYTSGLSPTRSCIRSIYNHRTISALLRTVFRRRHRHDTDFSKQHFDDEAAEGSGRSLRCVVLVIGGRAEALGADGELDVFLPPFFS